MRFLSGVTLRWFWNFRRSRVVQFYKIFNWNLLHPMDAAKISCHVLPRCSWTKPFLSLGGAGTNTLISDRLNSIACLISSSSGTRRRPFKSMFCGSAHTLYQNHLLGEIERWFWNGVETLQSSQISSVKPGWIPCKQYAERAPSYSQVYANEKEYARRALKHHAKARTVARLGRGMVPVCIPKLETWAVDQGLFRVSSSQPF